MSHEQRRAARSAEFFAGVREFLTEPTPAPRHARRAPREIGWTIAAGASIVGYGALVAGIFAGWWLA